MTKPAVKVPAAMKDKFDEIVALTDTFASEKLNAEYKGLIHQAVATLARKRPSPLVSGSAKVWACGTIHALGMVNFLFDKSQTPYVSNGDLIGWFEVSQSTASSKSKQIREWLDMTYMSHKWMLPSRKDDFLPAWMISVNGLIIDIRKAPPELQEIAFEKGLIPYVPYLRDAAA